MPFRFVLPITEQDKVMMVGELGTVMEISNVYLPFELFGFQFYIPFNPATSLSRVSFSRLMEWQLHNNIYYTILAGLISPWPEFTSPQEPQSLGFYPQWSASAVCSWSWIPLMAGQACSLKCNTSLHKPGANYLLWRGRPGFEWLCGSCHHLARGLASGGTLKCVHDTFDVLVQVGRPCPRHIPNLGDAVV